MNLDQIPLFIPSLYGDIRLTAQANQTEVEWENLSPSEREALLSLGRKFDVGIAGNSGKVTVAKPIEKVEAVLAKAMKRGRKLLSAVVFQNGRIEEIHRTADGEIKREPYRRMADRPTLPEVTEDIVKAAVTVAQPTLGCPVPEFERADVRATRVLSAFLSPQQLADFERTQSFLVVGADSGHRYVLTSRQATPERLAKVDGRSVFDLNRGHAVCVHDWVVPAAEELLELKLFLELEGHEAYVSQMPPGMH
jgi:hypothetical protein